MSGCSLAKVNAKATNCVCTRAVEAGEDWQDWEDWEDLGGLAGNWMGAGWALAGGAGPVVALGGQSARLQTEYAPKSFMRRNQNTH